MQKVIVIGGGIAGLTAGIYARKSGFDTTILEMHTIPGGNSTSWKRGGYLFEGGMHWLTGSKEGSFLHDLWQEVGALQANNPIHLRDPFTTWISGDERVCLYRDLERLEAHFNEISPEDSEATRRLCRDLKKFGAMQMPPMDVKGVKQRNKKSASVGSLLKMAPALLKMGEYSKVSCAELAARWKHPGIRSLIENITGADYSALAVSATLGTLMAGDGGYPEGGSLRMAQNMANTFAELGGRIEYSARAEKVIVEQGRAAGVQVGGEARRADAVIVTQDALQAMGELFDVPLQEQWMEDMRQNTTPLLCSFLCLGIEADLSDMPENVLMPLETSFDIAGIQYDHIAFNNYAAYPGYAPAGCTAMTTAFMGDSYDYWKQAKEDGSYAEKKAAAAQTFIDALAEKLPQTAGKVALWDLATPLTYARYCGSYKGSWMSFMHPGDTNTQYPLQTKSIAGLYFAGQRMMSPGGLPVALATGRQAVQCLCKDQGAVFG